MINKTFIPIFICCNLIMASLASHAFVDSSNYNINTTRTSDKNNSKTISWSTDVRLEQADFQSNKKLAVGNTVAITATAFGFSITNNNGDISGRIYVQFYPEDSWWNPKHRKIENLDEILQHEQLHFDICELYGRILYKEIIRLKQKNTLTGKNIEKLYNKLEKEYSKFQDEYDKETNHSINKNAQLKWNKLVKNKLRDMDKFSNYHSF